MVNQLNVYDMSLNRIGVLYSWVSMLWNEGYNTMGQFTLECQRSDEVMDLIQVNRWVGIAESDTLMIIVSIDIQGNIVIANGFPATWILEQRVSDTVISNQVAETAMRNLVSSMVSWDCVSLGDSAGISDRFSPEISDMSLEEYCETIGAECDIGFKFVYKKASKELLFTVYQPEKDINAKYSTKFGNVGDIEYILTDTDYKNVALVAGSGEGDERVTVWAGNTSLTGYERREMYVDARNEQPEDGESTSAYRQRLVEYGEGRLVEQLEVETISFNVSDDVALGAIVAVNLPEIFIKLEARVAEITIQSENNGTTREITVGTPFNITRL